MPQWAKDGLLVLCCKIPLNKHPEEISVFPDFLEIDIEEVGLGFYFEVPGFVEGG
jgi:hypothetical protein